MSTDGSPAPRDLSATDTDFSRLEGVDPDATGLRLAVGDLVGQRYRVVRFVARGGMGEVYEVVDAELQEHVALKTLRAERADHDRSVERLRREVASARKVTHRNVCRVFDVGTHRDGDEPPLVFLTMELLRGASLAEHLEARGALSIAEALPIARDMASALSAAHDAGIIHRDFKTHNVVLIGENAERSVVTDFGLAQTTSEARLEWGVSGTPAYMAPEQIDGQPASIASDVYAFGVVLYEMLTGVRPFAGETSLAGQQSASRTGRLRSGGARFAHGHGRTRVAPPPRTLVPSIPPAFEAALLACLARAPADRPPSIAAALGAMELAVRAPERGGAWRLRAPAIAVSAVALAAGLVWARAAAERADRETAGEATEAGAVALRRSVAVLGFEGLDAEDAWLAAALAHRLEAELAGGQQLRVVPQEDVERARRDLGDAIDAPSARAILRANLGADTFLYGSLHRFGSGDGAELELRWVLEDATSLDAIASHTETGLEADLPDLAGRAGAAVRARLGIAPLSSEERLAARFALPKDPVTAKLYAEGLFELGRYHNKAAHALLSRVVERSPTDFPLAYAALARATEGIGRETEATAIAKKGVDLAGRLSREARLNVEAQYYLLARDYERAAATYQALFAFFPDRIDYGASLAEAQMKSAHAPDALKTIEAMRALPAPLRDDPRIDYEEARAAHGSSSYARCLEAARRATERGREHHDWTLVARAGYLEGIALVNLGRTDEGRAVLSNARDLALEHDDLRSAGVLALPLAELEVASGDLDSAARGLEKMHGELEAIGSPYWAASAWERLGQIDVLRGRFGVGRRRALEAIEVYRSMNGTHALQTALSALGQLEARAGDLPRARELCAEGLEAAKKATRKAAEIGGHLCQALIARMSGDLARERTSEDEALGLARAANLPNRVAEVLVEIAERQSLEGDDDGARATLAEARALRQKSGHRLGESEAVLGLAEVALAEGRREEAVRLAREAGAFFARSDARVASARAIAVEALAAERDDDRRAAGAALTAAIGAIDPADLDASLDLRTSEAGLRARRGDRRAERDLEDLRARAEHGGFARIARRASALAKRNDAITIAGGRAR